MTNEEIREGENPLHLSAEALFECSMKTRLLLDIARTQAVEEYKKELRDGLEKMKKYTGGSSVNLIDLRVRLVDIYALLTPFTCEQGKDDEIK